MQVICTDGTVLQCQRFKAIDSGVLLFGESPSQGARGEEGEEEEEEEAEMEEEANAFVPIHQLRFVLPEGVQPGRSRGQSMGQTSPQAPPTGTPTPQQGSMPPQQQMGGQPSTQQGGQPQSPFDQSQRR